MRNPRNRLRRLSRFGALSLASVALVAGISAAPAAAAPAAVSAAATRPASQFEFVALGDSFTSGQGAPPYSDAACLTSRANSYPVVSSVLSRYSLTANKACSGATVAVVAGQFAGVSPSTKLVTLTVGGIDAGSTAVLVACGDSPAGPDADCLLELGQTETRLYALAAQLPGLYAAVSAAHPNARIAVLNYPLLFAPDTSLLGNLVNGGTLALNSVIQGSVGAVVSAGLDRIQYVDVTGEFAGHGIGSAVPYIAYDPADPTAPANFHPNAAGNAFGYHRALVNDGVLARP